MKELYYNDDYINPKLVFEYLKTNLDWLKVTDARYEYFMAKNEIDYTYGSGRGVRTYKSNPMDDVVNGIMNTLNKDFNTDYDICFLNRYDNEKMWLGWHADDSDAIDSNHPIGVISLGAVRDIWVKEMGYKGEIPMEDRYKLSSGSVFIMPSGFQETNYHKIPKSDVPCGTRISLTFRKYKTS